MTGAPTLVVGVGNRDRGDDAAGPVVCDLVDRRTGGAIPTLVVETSVLDLAHRWRPEDRVVVVDAAAPAGRPGRITELDRLALRPGTPVSTHSLDLAASVELAGIVDRLPASLTIVAIEGASFDFGAPLSDPVWRSVDSVAARLSRLAVLPAGDR